MAGRALRALTLVMVGIGIGFGVLSEVKTGRGAYDPHLFAIGISGLFALACTFIAYLIFRNRILKSACAPPKGAPRNRPTATGK